MGAFWNGVWTIAQKDLRSELRTKEAFNASFSFSLVILVLFSFAFDPTSEELHAIAGEADAAEEAAGGDRAEGRQQF